MDNHNLITLSSELGNVPYTESVDTHVGHDELVFADNEVSRKGVKGLSKYSTKFWVHLFPFPSSKAPKVFSVAISALTRTDVDYIQMQMFSILVWNFTFYLSALSFVP